MLVLSMLFITVVVLFIFSLTRDTGKHTKYARKGHHSPSTLNQETSHSVTSTDLIKVN